MFDMPIVDMTQVVNPVYSMSHFSPNNFSRHGVVERTRTTTSSAGYDARRFIQTYVRTPANVDRPQPASSRSVSSTKQESNVERTPLAKAKDDRLALLVQKYEGTVSDEDNARLAILTARIRRMSPRVSFAELYIMDEMVQSAEEVSDELANIRAQFNLG